MIMLMIRQQSPMQEKSHTCSVGHVVVKMLMVFSRRLGLSVAFIRL
jgi:hypothetical protein